MKCADCKQEQKNRCDKEGFDCTGGKQDLTPYKEDFNQGCHVISGHLQAEFGNKLTRFEELVNFASRMQYKKLGMAFCVGLADEASILAKMLGNKGFNVDSVCCKVCGLDKKDYEVPYAKKDKKFEALCNPIGQAMILNKGNTELNISVGLCVGHDILFQKYSEAPVTTFVAKDRVLAHNPLGVVYSSYYRKKFIGS
ncbi:Protein of unknown function DUF1847 [Desulfofarcimen acetoxidans DSM 771]|uniref:Metal-binding protein n=1 Tax=Desulfofarcimen acetoxidans (strain ATCC 49208 / DSM 771 / KCTC 5769 / VKM B-1644 / 5575) TaxID=485916 RepID=C8W2J9_DESAS|nr:DUF1847 domain-containing protein [Desulfofarcimen acetoxidans]ACV63683.1 Protein of unknown function DUF1847 [Desulfofarcimen acetoxidans DSM 771]